MKRAAQLSFSHELTFTTTRPKRGRWFLAALVLLVVAGGLAYALLQHLPPLAIETATSPAIGKPATMSPAPAVAVTPEASPEIKVDIAYVVRPNDTLGDIFSKLKIDVNVLPAILELPAVRDRFKPLQPGDELTFALVNGSLHGIERRVSETEILAITRGNGGFGAKIVPTPVQIKNTHVRGTINPSQFATGRAAGLTPEMVQQLASDIFGWDINFARDIRSGDRFNLIYEQKFRGDEYLGDGRIIAAEFVNNGELHRAVRYTSPDGKIDGYFTPDGNSLRRQFLRAPLDFTRVSASAAHGSGELTLSLMSEHNGVDYPAPVGTVVKAAADGRIKSIGADGEYGNAIIIDHADATSTLYAHLSAFERGLQPGQRVKQGDSIGYVGSSGAATAPHLHYEVRVEGKYIDPRSLERPATASIPANYLPDFQSKSAALLEALKQSSDVVVTAALTR